MDDTTSTSDMFCRDAGTAGFAVTIERSAGVSPPTTLRIRQKMPSLLPEPLITDWTITFTGRTVRPLRASV
jgi:hypothetical protein